MTERVYVASDVHDDVEALAKFADFAQAQEADKVLFLGDFSLRPYTRESLETLAQSPQQREDFERFISDKQSHNEGVIREMKGILDATGIDYLVIPGNYDPNTEHIFGARDIHKKTAQLKDATIVGYGGADAYPQQIMPLVQMGEIVPYDHAELFNTLDDEKADILMLHNPPRGLCDDMFNGAHPGSSAASEYIHANVPKLALAGHIHEAGPLGNNPNGRKGIAKLGSTYIVNPGNLGRFELVNPDLSTQMAFPYGTFVGMELEDDGSLTSLTQYSIAGKEGKEAIREVESIGRI